MSRLETAVPEPQPPHDLPAPSPQLLAHLEALGAVQDLGPVVDLACGRGRHALVAARAGLVVIAVDRSRDFLGELGRRADNEHLRLARLQTDLETSFGLPFIPGSCGAILVYRFLFRPLAPAIESALAPGGLLLYETFTKQQLELGYGPRNPEFLLDPGELPSLFPGLDALEYEELFEGEPRPNAIARLTARKPS